MEDNNYKYYNEYGGFIDNGKEYCIKINAEKKLPAVWSNVMANNKIGTIVTENMGGYTWYKNSKLNRITAFNNSSTTDIPSEIIYIKDNKENKTWSLGLNPMPDKEDYVVTYGFGYAKYFHECCGIKQENIIFIPQEDGCKINVIKFENTKPFNKKLDVYYYLKPVLGEDETITNKYINVNLLENNNLLLADNLFNTSNYMPSIFISSSEKIFEYTGNKKNFIGENSISNPKAIIEGGLDNKNGLGNDSCIVVKLEVELESFETKNISIIIGIADEENYKDIAYKYCNVQNCLNEFDIVKKNWKEKLEKIQVETPVDSVNIILNGWAMYQTISSRLIGRSGFYQSGGAYGFRDQLQDTMGIKYIDASIMKNQIIKHSMHQFMEGDVEHWWHDEIGKGIRTRFSDDLLWLVYTLCDYICFTEDYSILDIQIPYIQGKILNENEDERYDKYNVSDIEESILKHCLKALEKSLSFGENGLPKIGTGDWNDGLSSVGNKGKGESVWLGFFQYSILDKFIPICEKYVKNNNLSENNELVTKIEKYKIIKNNLKKTLNNVAWDGRWFKRAFCDDGQVLGTIENEECKIDSISQSWSVISNAGDNDKKYISMESLENHLIDMENGIIKLLDPPFEKSTLEPGYIKSYLPGVRENGGQYTHGAVWTIIAEAILGFGDKALELYRMINPIEHSRTIDEANKYKVEPYVMAADIYGEKNLVGRGGWTWYTGSSSWYYIAGIEYILGLKINGNKLTINPCIPKDWKGFSIRYRYKTSLYKINVKNINLKNTGIEKFIMNGNEIKEKIVNLVDDGNVNNIEIIM